MKVWSADSPKNDDTLPSRQWNERNGPDSLSYLCHERNVISVVVLPTCLETYRWLESSPRHQLDEGWGQTDSSQGVHNGGAGVADEVA